MTGEAWRGALVSVAPPGKKRPVLILTRDSVLAYLGEATIAPVTRAIRDTPFEVRLGPEDGLPRPCAVHCDHLQTVSKARLGKLITHLPAERMEDVGRAVSFALDF